jgi:tetratricopeptide (TPR) repeat protein
MKCPKCDAEQKGAIDTCGTCGAYMLPRRTIGERVFGFFVGLALLAAIVFAPLVIKQPWAFWVAFFILIVPLAKAFSTAFKRFPLAEAYAQRARRHAKTEPEQAILDLGKAIELAKAPGRYYVERAGVYEATGGAQSALDDLHKFLELPRKDQKGIKVDAVKKAIAQLRKQQGEA